MWCSDENVLGKGVCTRLALGNSQCAVGTWEATFSSCFCGCLCWKCQPYSPGPLQHPQCSPSPRAWHLPILAPHHCLLAHGSTRERGCEGGGVKCRWETPSVPRGILTAMVPAGAVVMRRFCCQFGGGKLHVHGSPPNYFFLQLATASPTSPFAPFTATLFVFALSLTSHSVDLPGCVPVAIGVPTDLCRTGLLRSSADTTESCS